MKQQVLNKSVCRRPCLSCVACKLHLFCAALHCHQWPVWLYHIFPHYLTNGKSCGKTRLTNIRCVLIFSTTFVWNISHSKKKLARYYHKYKINNKILHAKYPLFLSHFNQTWSFSTNFSKILKYQISRKNCPVEAELFHTYRNGRTDGRTDRYDEGNNHFSQFANVPTNNNNNNNNVTKVCDDINNNNSHEQDDRYWIAVTTTILPTFAAFQTALQPTQTFTLRVLGSLRHGIRRPRSQANNYFKG
jgi:hypothetical protein